METLEGDLVQASFAHSHPAGDHMKDFTLLVSISRSVASPALDMPCGKLNKLFSWKPAILLVSSNTF